MAVRAETRMRGIRIVYLRTAKRPLVFALILTNLIGIGLCAFSTKAISSNLLKQDTKKTYQIEEYGQSGDKGTKISRLFSGRRLSEKIDRIKKDLLCPIYYENNIKKRVPSDEIKQRPEVFCDPKKCMKLKPKTRLQMAISNERGSVASRNSCVSRITYYYPMLGKADRAMRKTLHYGDELPPMCPCCGNSPIMSPSPRSLIENDRFWHGEPLLSAPTGYQTGKSSIVLLKSSPSSPSRYTFDPLDPQNLPKEYEHTNSPKRSKVSFHHISLGKVSVGEISLDPNYDEISPKRSLEQRSPGKTLEQISPFTLEQSSQDNFFERMTLEKGLEQIPPGRTSEQSLPGKLSEISSPEKTLEPVSPRKVSQQNWLRNSSEKMSPERTLLEKTSPQRTLQQSLPGKNSEKMSPEKTLERISPRRTVEESSPGKTSEKISPQEIFQRISPDRTLQQSSSEKTFEKMSPRRTLEGSSPGKTSDKTSPEKIIQQISPNRTLQKSSPRKTFEKMSPEKTLERMPPGRTLEGSSPGKTSEKMSPEEILQRISPSRTLQQSSPGKTFEKMSPEKTLERISPRRTLERSTPGKTSEKISPKETLEIPPRRALEQSSPKNQSIMGRASLMTEGKDTKYFEQEKTVQQKKYSKDSQSGYNYIEHSGQDSKNEKTVRNYKLYSTDTMASSITQKSKTSKAFSDDFTVDYDASTSVHHSRDDSYTDYLQQYSAPMRSISIIKLKGDPTEFSPDYEPPKYLNQSAKKDSNKENSQSPDRDDFGKKQSSRSTDSLDEYLRQTRRTRTHSILKTTKYDDEDKNTDVAKDIEKKN